MHNDKRKAIYIPMEPANQYSYLNWYFDKAKVIWQTEVGYFATIYLFTAHNDKRVADAYSKFALQLIFLLTLILWKSQANCWADLVRLTIVNIIYMHNNKCISIDIIVEQSA